MRPLPTVDAKWIILFFAGVIFVGSLANGLGGASGNGVWHSLYDVSKTPLGDESVDPNQNGEIDFIEDNIVTSQKLLDGSVAFDDVNPNDVCAIGPFDVPTGACVKAIRNTGCSTIFSGPNGGNIALPSKCKPNDSDASGSCVLAMTLINSSTGAAVHYGKWTHTQFDNPAFVSGTGQEQWFASDRAFYPSSGTGIFNPVGEPEPAYGNNGDSTAVSITQPGFVQSNSGQSVSNIILQDDNPGQGETDNGQWYLLDTNPNYSVRLEVC